MGREKLPMALVPDVGKRNQVFRNRRKGLLKKCEELSKLCGIEVCMISSPPESSKKHCFKTETYPEDADEVKRIVKEYRVLAGECGNNAKNQVTLADVLRDKKAKLEQELALLRQPPSYPLEKGGLDGMTETFLHSMAVQLDSKHASIKAAIAQRRQEAAAATAEPASCYYIDDNYFKKQCFKTETYPEDADEVKRIVKEYRVLAGECGNNAKNQVTLADVLRDKKAKLEQELALLRQPPSYPLEEGGLDGMTETFLHSMAVQLDSKLASIKAAIAQRHQEAAAATAEPSSCSYIDDNYFKVEQGRNGSGIAWKMSIAEPSSSYYIDNNYFTVEQSSSGCGVDWKTAISEPPYYVGDSGSMVWNKTTDCLMPGIDQAQPLNVCCEGSEFAHYDMEGSSFLLHRPPSPSGFTNGRA